MILVYRQHKVFHFISLHLDTNLQQLPWYIKAFDTNFKKFLLATYSISLFFYTSFFLYNFKQLLLDWGAEGC